MRPMRCASWPMCARLPRTSSIRPRSASWLALSDSVVSAVSGWFSSCVMPAAIWPSTASLPACTAASRVSRRMRCVASSASTLEASAALAEVNSTVRWAMRASRSRWTSRSAARALRCSSCRRARSRSATNTAKASAIANAALAPATSAVRCSARGSISTATCQPSRPIGRYCTRSVDTERPGSATRSVCGARSAEKGTPPARTSSGASVCGTYCRVASSATCCAAFSVPSVRYFHSGTDDRKITPWRSTSSTVSPLRASVASNESRLILTATAPMGWLPSRTGAARK